MILLQNIRFLLTQNREREILENVDVIIREDRIFRIGENLSDKYEVEDVINCTGKAVLPGLINCHTHAAMSLFRGISDNKRLQRWLEEDIFPAEEKLEGEDVFWGTDLAAVEMMESGTTCFNDMYFHADFAARAVEETGIRAVLTKGMADIEEAENLGKAERFLYRFSDSERIMPGLGPHAVYTCSEGLLLDSKELTDRHDALYHIHVSETEKENHNLEEEKGMTPVQYLENLDILDDDTLIAHGVHLNQEDMEILSARGVGLAHNPAANLKLGSGIADIPRLRDEGVKVGIGTDGPASNNNLNLFDEAKIAALVHKRKDPEKITEQDILDMITIEAAEVLGLENQIGSVEEGKKADIFAVDIMESSLTPFHSSSGFLSNLIYSFNGGVEDLIVGGEEVIRNGNFQDLNREKLLKNAQRRSGKFS